MTDNPASINVFDPSAPASTAEVAGLRMRIDALEAKLNEVIRMTLDTDVPQPAEPPAA